MTDLGEKGKGGQINSTPNLSLCEYLFVYSHFKGGGGMTGQKPREREREEGRRQKQVGRGDGGGQLQNSG